MMSKALQEKPIKCSGIYFRTSASKYWRYLEFQLTLEIFQIQEIGKQLPFNFSKEIGSICTP